MAFDAVCSDVGRARSTELARGYSPEMVEDLHGMAENSRLRFDELTLLQP